MPTTNTAALASGAVIPAPVSQIAGTGEFRFGPATGIAASDAALPVAEYLAELLRPATGFALPVGSSGEVALAIEGDHTAEGYELSVTEGGIRITAGDAAGLFWGVQTLRQLLPPAASATTTSWAIPATTIRDHPRFAYRGAMLDVARHFFGVDDVTRYIDHIALLKLNVLHLHLSDDQGWRLQIDSWPRLTEHGGSTQVGGGGGGYYTKDDFRAIVAYAASRHITVVPEIDMPGHTNAALSSYPELNCDGTAPALYEGIEVGFSSLCIGQENTYQFVTDVVAELVELTPGPWVHIGGDESLATPEADFVTFVDRAGAIVAAHGKTVIGWHEMGKSTGLPAGTIGQYWNFTTPEGDAAAVSQNFIDNDGQLIMSPADVAYLDMKYDPSSPLGLVWAKGPTSVPESYLWDPADILPGVGDAKILGVEAPVWTETIATLSELESMAFPRIAAVAEIAWSPQSAKDSRAKDFGEFAARLASFGRHLDALGIQYYRSSEVPWEA